MSSKLESAERILAESAKVINALEPTELGEALAAILAPVERAADAELDAADWAVIARCRGLRALDA